MSEDDETTTGATLPVVAGSAPSAAAEDNSLGRLLTLSDGIFAIAMTLLALDLRVPELGSHPGNSHLTQELAKGSSSYLSFLLSFYVVATYWLRHRQLMRSVVTVHPALIRDTLFLLVLVAAMPFPTSLLGRYGSTPISLAVYGAFNAVAVVTLMVLSHDIRRLHLGDDNAAEYVRHWQAWLTLGVFLLCIPAGYLADGHGAYVLILLAVPNRLTFIRRIIHRHRATAADETSLSK